jgi:PhoD related phosphatase
MSEEHGQTVWHGTVLIVTRPCKHIPQLELAPANQGATAQKQKIEGLKLYADPQSTFWRFSLKVPLGNVETKWQYTIHNLDFRREDSTGPSRNFYVPSAQESMRIMFHSCNGFSVGTDEDFWSGPAVWNDVLRTHEKRPFHVMIGGGDQIYNDNIRTEGPLKEWTAIKNPAKRRHHKFPEDLRARCDKFYFENYVRWYRTEPFATANAAIAQINIWDDHDIIDGFGSYTDGFMRCDVFRGIGGVSLKYYCLFQHHTAPPRSTYTTDAPETMKAGLDGSAGYDPRQMENSYVYKRTADDPSWIVGKQPGPYVEERSRSLYMRLGKHIAFCGIDARTERTRHQVNYPETYDQIFHRLHSEVAASHGDIKHLILLLGVPIAYPRLAWLENIFASPLIAPIKLLNKRFGFGGGFFNSFDGEVDLLDDLDDHYTAKYHKAERKALILRLQEFSKQFSVRVTILGGDVHLAACGRFYSMPKLNMEAAHDPRFMTNIISSAITNKPPPKAVANLLARRNKIHHLHDGSTDETLLKLFNKQPGGIMKSAEFNQCTMPSRNYACITEVPGSTPETNGHTNAISNVPALPHDGSDRLDRGRDGHSPLHSGEEGAGTDHPAADGVNTQGGIPGGLNVSIRVEIDNRNRDGQCQGYGFSSQLTRYLGVHLANSLPVPMLTLQKV